MDKKQTIEEGDATTMKRVTWKDFPIKSPCEMCGMEKWRECYDKAKACDTLWNFLAFRGDWVMKQNDNIEKCSPCPIKDTCPCDHHFARCNWREIFIETGEWGKKQNE